MNATPCLDHAALYDIALYGEDVPMDQRTAAAHAAARLCGGCPVASTCTGRVTLDTAPRELALLSEDWLPAAREGVRAPEEKPRRGWSADRRATAAITTGRDYIPPAKRPTAWARMAAGLAATGRTVPQIAEELCVTEDTARALLALPLKGVIAA